MTLQIGFTGTGYISKRHARAAGAIEGVELAAIVNHRQESMAAFAEELDIPRQYSRIEDLLEAGSIDAVVISTPNYLHAHETIAALHAGVHVLVEKPMAMNAVEAGRMLRASEKNGARLMVAHCWRFDQEVRWLRRQVDQDRLGPILRTKGYGVHANWGPGGWFTQAKFAGGGALADMGIHALDTARYLMGDPWPQSVFARIGTYYGDFEVDDTGVILIDWDNGAVSYLESGWWQPHVDGPEASTQLYGRKGFGSVYPTLLGMPNPQAESVDEVNPGYPFPREEHAPQEMYEAQMDEFIDCIRSGRTPSPGGLEGLVNMLVVDAAYQSARSGQVVPIVAREDVLRR